MFKSQNYGHLLNIDFLNKIYLKIPYFESFLIGSNKIVTPLGRPARPFNGVGVACLVGQCVRPCRPKCAAMSADKQTNLIKVTSQDFDLFACRPTWPHTLAD
ncbi:hypothetical protein BpHYR1_030401 [Brachionus plicatilis]|uniref:Uncharacterized protein n=1 Tax=Brachionus plicatilis TaxID=10195 RepID=A0A3M7T2F9_BRAPC|nr:hypothetical protein BpHYR1_030401 [Brachionus plicatilis]